MNQNNQMNRRIKMKSRKIVAVLLVLVMLAVLTLSACKKETPATPTTTPAPGTTAPATTNPSPPPSGADLGRKIGEEALAYGDFVKSEIKPGAVSSKDTFTFAAIGDPGKIMSGNMRDLTFYPLSTSVQQYFLLYDYELGRYISPILESYEPDPDYKGVTFHIIPGIKMHDGNILGPSDIIASIEAFRKHNGMGWQLDFVDLEAAKIIDDKTIHFPFNRVNGVWASGFEMLTIISGKAYKAAGEDVSFYQKPIGPMAYIITEWVSGDHITLTRFDDYFMGTPPIKTIVMKIISDRTAAFMALQNGEIDLLWNISSDQVKTVYSSDRLKNIMTGRNFMIYMAMNSGNKALSDFRVRQAIYYAVNRDDIIKGAYDGLATPAFSILTPEGIGYNKNYETNSPFPARDVNKAKALLAEAGYGNGLTLRIIAESSINFQMAVEQLALQLGEVGITLEATLTDMPSMMKVVNGGDPSAYDLFLHSAKASGESISTIDNPDLFGASHPELSADGSGAEYKALWDKVRGTPDINQRAEAYKAVQAFFFEKGLYWMPLAVAQTYIGLDKDLTGIRLIGFQGFFAQAYFR